MRLIITIFCFLVSYLSFSQRDIQGIGQWKYHVPFNAGKAIADVGDKVYCGTILGLFSYDKSSGELETYTKIEGLNDIEISTLNYYEPLDILFIAYVNGNIDVIQNNTIINLGDVERKQIVGVKSINSIYFHNDFAYVNSTFGVVVYDLKKLEVKETYSSLGKNGESQEVFASTVVNDSLYLATDIGVLSGSIAANSNLLDFNNWSHLSNSKSIRSIVNVKNELFVLPTDTNYLLKKTNTGWDTITEYGNVANIFEGKDELLIISEDKLISSDLSTTNELDITGVKKPIQPIRDENIFWFCDQENGLIKLENNVATRLVPSGPSLSSIFRINYYNDRIYVNAGGYGSTFKRQFGITIVDIMADGNWFNIGYWQDTSLNPLADIVSTLQRSDGTTFLASHGFGLIQKDLDGNFTSFDHTNSPIRNSLDDKEGFDRVIDLALDKNQNVWITNHGTLAGDSSIFKIDKDGKWEAFAFPQINNSNYPEKIIIDNQGNKWVTLATGPTGNGVMVFNEETEESRLLTTGFENGDLQNTKITDMAVDKDGAVWLAGRSGVSYFPNPSQIFEGGEQNDATKPIFDGRPLLEEEFIKAMAVDGGNRKWFGSENGLWLMDPTGTEVIKNFNVTNSPLPTNKINDIEINQKTGEVFIGTDLGLISYRSDATEGNSNCKGKAKVFPNPVKPDYSGEVGITDLSDDAEIKITDTWGNLIYETTANGGAASWNLKDYNGNKAATGVYMILVNGQGRKKSCVTRLAIVN